MRYRCFAGATGYAEAVVLTSITVVVLGLAIAFSLAMRRSLRKMRRGDEQWRAQWRALDPQRRSSIVRAMRSGMPVREPEDARLALRAVAQVEHVRRAMRPINAVGHLAAIAILITGLILRQYFLAITGGIGVAGAAVAGGLAWRQRRRFERSAAASRATHSWQ